MVLGFMFEFVVVTKKTGFISGYRNKLGFPGDSSPGTD